MWGPDHKTRAPRIQRGDTSILGATIATILIQLYMGLGAHDHTVVQAHEQRAAEHGDTGRERDCGHRVKIPCI